VVTGVITAVDKDLVLVDIGYKSEGQIRINEFRAEDGTITARVGDRVEVMVEWWDDEDERVILSKEKAANIKVWDNIKKCHDEDGTIRGAITSRSRADSPWISECRRSCRAPRRTCAPSATWTIWSARPTTSKILKYNRQTQQHRAFAAGPTGKGAREQARGDSVLDPRRQGADGIVKNITEYGVFVDLGGVDGLLHITDISWGRVKHPSTCSRSATRSRSRCST